MKVEELRIGNYINWEQTTHVVSGLPNLNMISSYWVKDNIPQEENEYRGFIKEAKPIPLNEEWLLKFDFEPFFGLGLVKRGLSMDGTVAHFSFDYCRLGEQANYLENDDFVEIPMEVKYVHQLQNLYYALTGEELTLNEI